MKTKDVISMLQEADPSGELQVCVGNEDIFFAEHKEAYWDGTLQVLIRDKSLKRSYNIEGVEFRSLGSKIDLHTMSFQDVLLEDPEAKMKYETEYAKKRMESYVQKERVATRKLISDIEEELAV